ncbi:polyprenyl synthetase family protein [Embleya sp. MST-111070]|uniref:polyprenyl synthetase family protein n=1 Tax=Embleya sp. MST-111070 TaxID=3398231 RepID=UPI003F740183
MPVVVAGIPHERATLHDDIIDLEARRRGRPTVLAAYSAGHAIMLGDALPALVFAHVGEHPHPRIRQVLRIAREGWVGCARGGSATRSKRAAARRTSTGPSPCRRPRPPRAGPADRHLQRAGGGCRPIRMAPPHGGALPQRPVNGIASWSTRQPPSTPAPGPRRTARGTFGTTPRTRGSRRTRRGGQVRRRGAARRAIDPAGTGARLIRSRAGSRARPDSTPRPDRRALPVPPTRTTVGGPVRPDPEPTGGHRFGGGGGIRETGLGRVRPAWKATAIRWAGCSDDPTWSDESLGRTFSPARPARAAGIR